MNQKTTIPTVLGTTLEWAEYTFFAYIADYLSPLFFPSNDPDLARLKMYGVFAVSYLVRPLGALLFGYIGDIHGRKPALISSMLLMCLATSLLGCIPTYHTLGETAAVLLILCRLLQGLAVAGEFSGAAIVLFEQNRHHRYFNGALTPFAAAAGMSLGALMATLVTLPSAPSFSWRIPFLLSSGIGLVGLYLRSYSLEPTKTSTQRKTNLDGFWLTASFALFISIYVYIGNLYYKTLCITEGHFAPALANSVITIGQLLAAFFTLFFGWVADRTHGKTLCALGLFLGIILSPFIIFCAQSGSFSLSIIGQLCYALINGMVSATMMTLLLEKFSTSIRYRGKSIAWSLSSALFGGTALLTAESLHNKLGTFSISLYLSCAAGTTLLALYLTDRHTISFKHVFKTLLPSNL